MKIAKIYTIIVIASLCSTIGAAFGADPVITTQPVTQVVKQGLNAVFTVGGENIVSYQWYRNSAALSDGGNIAGATTSSLTVSNVMAADEAEYFCKVTGTTSIDSSKAMLITGRVIGWWKFEGNLSDSSGLGNNGTAMGTVDYGTGVDGAANSALVLANANESDIATNFVRIADPKYSTNLAGSNFLDYTAGPVSISCWIKPAFSYSYEMYVSVGIPGYGAWYCGRFAGNDSATFVTAGSSRTISSRNINDGTWHLYTAVLDFPAGKRYLYIDGTIQDEDSASLIPGVDLLIGALNWKEKGSVTDSFRYGFSGSIDEVRIYTYALSKQEAAQMYYDVTGISPCLGYPEGDMDQNCTVNLGDFAAVAQNWMECNLFPASACN